MGQDGEDGKSARVNHDMEVQLQDEIDANRRAEFTLIPKALVALLVVAVLVAIRVVFFS